jgi:hypothetical protein
MKQVLLAIGVAALSSAGILAANDDVRVRLTGCVLDGKDGSFVLSDVQELSGGKMSPTSNLYWLSTTKGLKEQIGHRIEVTGTFSPSRDVGKTGTIKTKLDPATGHETIEIENGAKKAEASTTADPSVAGTTGVKTEVTKPYRRLQVQNLTRFGATCAP